MAAIGVFSDSHGDLAAFEAAYELLKTKGARRFIFTGGRYTDLDEWIVWKKDKARGGRAYSDADFLADISNFLTAKEQLPRPAAFGEAGEEVKEGEDLTRLKDKFVRVPERDCLQYRDPGVSRKAVDMLGDALCTIVHDKNDLDREDLLNSMVFIHGKESEPKVVQIGPRFFLTPGSLTGAAEQTCGLIETVEKSLRFSAFTLDGKKVIDGKTIAVGGGKTKLSVK
jgi:hypothetical protein